MRILAILTLGVVLSQFYRSTMAILAPALSTDLGAGSAELGRLSGTWFFAFALVQIPVGVLLDRWGPQRSAAGGLLLASVGAGVFASAPSLSGAYLGQALLGLGCAPLYMSTVVLMARNWPPRRFAVLNGAVVGTSNAGLLISATPLAALMEWLGWRGALWTMAAVTLALAIAIAGGRKVDKGTGTSVSEVIRGVASVSRHRKLWPLLAYAFACSGVFFAVRGIWGGPYLDRVFGLSPIERGNVLAVMVMVLASSNMGFGWLSSRLGSPRPFILALTAMGVTALVALAAAPSMPLVLASACLAALGLFAGSYGLIVAHARAFFPKGMEGRGATLLNFFNFLGTATIQVASGETMAAAERAGLEGADSFRWMYALLAVALMGSLAVYFKSADPRRA